jgi:hypothetical protein
MQAIKSPRSVGFSEKVEEKTFVSDDVGEVVDDKQLAQDKVQPKLMREDSGEQNKTITTSTLRQKHADTCMQTYPPPLSLTLI